MNNDNKPASTNYRDTLKSMDTEEHIDLAFYRPIGYAWACLAKKLGVTPNAITIASIFLGIGAGIAFYFNDMWINVAGMLLLVCLRENYSSEFIMAHPWLIWVIAVVTGICHAKQAAMADYYRQFHLYFLKGEEGSELENADNLKKKLAELSWSRNFWKKLTMTFYTNYTVNQEATTRSMQELRAELRRRFPDGVVPQSFRDAFRIKSLPLMKYTNILSFNWRTIALFTSLFLQMPWLYFAFELTVLNILLIYMVIRHEKICKTFTNQLKDGKY